MLTRVQKEEQVAEIRDKMSRANSIFVADYKGVDVRSVGELRSKIRAAGEFEYRVAKNTLLKIAADGNAAESIQEHFQGPTAVAFSFGDPVALAKVLVDYADENEHFELRGGLVDGNAVSSQEIATLATLPSLDQLRGKIVGLLQAPATKVVQVLSAPASQLARVLDARRAQLEEGA